MHVCSDPCGGPGGGQPGRARRRRRPPPPPPQPGGPGWKAVTEELPEVKSDAGYAQLFGCWLLGVVLVYAVLFGIGKLLMGNHAAGIGFLALGILSGFAINRLMRREKAES